MINDQENMKYVLLSISLMILFLSCSNEKNQQKQVVENFPVVSPMLVDTTLSTDYVAEINAVQNVEIRARVKGYLDKVFVDEGKYVKQGQLLFTINNPELSEQIIKAGAVLKSNIAELHAAEIEMNNVKRLVEKNIVSNTELDVAKNKIEMMNAKIEEAKANESYAKIQITYTQVKAPFNGIINRIPNKIGSLVEDGTLLTNISNNNEVFAYFDVSEKEYLNYAINIKENSQQANDITLILANGEEHPFKGKIETTEGEIDPSTGNIAFRARFNNPDKILKHGASGKVRLLKKYRNALIIPQKATFEIQDRIYVYVIDKNNKVSSKPIISTRRLPHFYIVESGLTQNDKVIYEGIQDIKEGMTITPQYLKMNDIKLAFTKKP